MCEEYSALEPLKLSPKEWNFLGEIHEVMLPYYEKTLLVSQDSPTIIRATAIYWDLDDIMDDVIEMKGNYELINEQIRQAVIAGRKALDEYTSKMDTETLIPYAAAVHDPRVKTEYLKAHLREGAEAVIDNLRTHFKELSYSLLLKRQFLILLHSIGIKDTIRLVVQPRYNLKCG